MAELGPSERSTHFNKLPYIGPFSNVAQTRIRQLASRYCSNSDIKLVSSSFKIRNLFGVKDSIPRELRSWEVYKFLCTNCNVSYNATLLV